MSVLTKRVACLACGGGTAHGGLIFRARLRFLSVVAQLSQDEATMVRERMFLHKLNSALVQVRGDVTVAVLSL